MICAGVDAGSRTIKVVLLDGPSLRVVGSGVVDQGVEQDLLARRLLEAVLRDHGLHRDDVQTIVATGYGRKLIRDADATITEITCQAAGVAHVVPGSADGHRHRRTGQQAPAPDSRWPCERFRHERSMRRRDRTVPRSRGDSTGCATGMFGRDGESESNSSHHQQHVRGVCRNGNCGIARPGDCAGGHCRRRSSRDCRAGDGDGRREATAPIVFTGGVARVPGMDVALDASLGQSVTVAADPQLTCSRWAPLFSQRRSPGNLKYMDKCLRCGV